MAQGRHLAPKGGKVIKSTDTPESHEKMSTGKNDHFIKYLLFCLVLIGILFVCVVMLAVVYFFARSKVNKLNYIPDTPNEGPVEIREEIPEAAWQKTEEGKAMENTLVEEEVELSEGEIIEDKNILNIMLVGTDFKSKEWDDPGRADVTMLCSINKKEGTVKLISFERGIMVPIPGKGSDLLTHSYVWGGMNLLLQDLKDCFLLDIDGYMHVDFDSFQEVIDTVGGVTIELTETEAYTLNDWGVTVPLKAGPNTLDGYTALRYCRLRKIDSNFGRIERQRKTIQALMDKAKDLSILELNDAADEVLPLIDTNIDTKTFMSLLKSAPKFLDLKAEQYQVPEENDSSRISFSYEADRLKNIIYGE